MTPAEAVPRLETILAHAWMVRTFLKHAEEIQDDADFLEVPRAVFDYCRAVEPAMQRGDHALYCHRARSKLSKLRKASDYPAANSKRVTDHTNWQMASASLTGCVAAIEAILAEVPKGFPPPDPDAAG